MRGLLKIQSTSTLLAAHANHSQQKMPFHRDHRNLLLFCHSLQANNSRLNTAQCCLLMDNLINKKPFLIQSRGLRHKAGSTDSEKTAADADSSSAAEEEAHQKMDPPKMEYEFKAKFAEFMVKFREDVKAGNAKMGDFSVARNQFIEKFNEEHANSGFKIEQSEEHQKYEKMLPFVLPTFTFFLLSMVYLLRPCGTLKPEHRQIVAQPPITYNQFVQDYLSTGEVEFIFHYPQQNLAVAILRPDALINGEPFNQPGLHIALDESFRFLPMSLTQRIRDEESRIGVRDMIPVGIRQVSPGTMMSYYFGTFVLCWFLGAQFGRWLVKYRHRMFRAVPVKRGVTDRKKDLD